VVFFLFLVLWLRRKRRENDEIDERNSCTIPKKKEFKRKLTTTGERERDKEREMKREKELREI
jgi:hypothetical protein